MRLLPSSGRVRSAGAGPRAAATATERGWTCAGRWIRTAVGFIWGRSPAGSAFGCGGALGPCSTASAGAGWCADRAGCMYCRVSGGSGQSGGGTAGAPGCTGCGGAGWGSGGGAPGESTLGGSMPGMPA
eukprot:scaffold29722_cov94-Isochrysis_galbana.AAC.1